MDYFDSSGNRLPADPFPLEQGSAIHAVIAGELEHLSGILRCNKCHLIHAPGDIQRKLREGWPKCCGETMIWWTGPQIERGEVPDL